MLRKSQGKNLCQLGIDIAKTNEICDSFPPLSTALPTCVVQPSMLFFINVLVFLISAVQPAYLCSSKLRCPTRLSPSFSLEAFLLSLQPPLLIQSALFPCGKSQSNDLSSCSRCLVKPGHLSTRIQQRLPQSIPEFLFLYATFVLVYI